MLPTESLNQFSGIVSQFQKAHSKCATNFFLMPSEIKELCEKKRLFVSQSGGLMKILCDRVDYYSFYYYADRQCADFDISDVLEKAGDKDVLTDAVMSTRRSAQVGFPIVEMLEKGIIREYKSYKRMVFENEVDFSSCVLADGYEEMKREDIFDELTLLWKTALDEKSTPLPEKDEVETLYNDGKLFTVCKNDSTLAAVGVLAVSGRQAMIQHVAVSPDERRKGLARYILKRLISLSKELDIRVLRLWVDNDNLPAVTLYDRNGFVPDGTICSQYIFTRRKQS